MSGSVEITNSREAAVRRNKNYSGVVLWLAPAGRAAPPPAPVREQMLQKGRHFLPHVLVLPVGGTVDFPNRDPIYHNAFSNFAGQPFDTALYPPGTSRAVIFRTPGIVRVFCNIHATMSAIIAVVATPWYAVTPADGKFAISGLPPGDYELHIFHERVAAGGTAVSRAHPHGSGGGAAFAVDFDFRNRLHSRAAPQQVRAAISAVAERRHVSGGAEMKLRFSSLPLLAKILLSTSVLLTARVRSHRRNRAQSYPARHVGQPGAGGAGQLSGLHFSVQVAGGAAGERQPDHGHAAAGAAGVQHGRPGHHRRHGQRDVVEDLRLQTRFSW